jgi:hypothetical protein
MTSQYEGGCHCGAVRYKCSKVPELTFYCHCQDCQKTTGSPYSMELMIEKPGFAVSGATQSYAVTGDSGSSVYRRFCSNCGSGVFLECDAYPDYIFLKVGSLDDGSWVTPDMHIYTAAKQPWVHIADGIPQHEKQPDE